MMSKNKFILIDSKQNSHVKTIIKLSTDSRYRKDLQRAVIYGEKLLQEAMKLGVVEKVFCSQIQLVKYQKLFSQIAEDNIYTLSPELIKYINLAPSEIEIIAIIKVDLPKIDDKVFVSDCVVLDKIQDPGNLGTIIRAAAGCGIKHIVLSVGCADAYSPKVMRSSSGIQLGINIYSGIAIDDFLRNYRGKIMVTVPTSGVSIYRYPFKQTMPVAWVFGNEAKGIDEQIVNDYSNKVTIPMPGVIESLNVAMAATICLFEMVRQRSEV